MRNRLPAGLLPQRRGEQGTAYVVTLMVLIILSILGLSVSLISQTEILAGGQERAIEQTFYTAETGVNAAIASLLAQNNYDRPVTVERQRVQYPGEAVANVQERAQNPGGFPCRSFGICSFCSMNQDRQFYRRNQVLSVNAIRYVGPAGTETVLGRRQIAMMVDSEPFREEELGRCFLKPEEVGSAFSGVP